MTPTTWLGVAGWPVAHSRSPDIQHAALRAAGIDAAHALTDLEPDRDRCMTEAGPLLERLAQRIAAEHLPTPA